MAALFEFRLEPLLRLRVQAEKTKQRVVARRLIAISEAQRRMEEIATQERAERARLREASGPGSMSVDEVMASRGWIGRLQRDRWAIAGQIAAHEQQLAVERAALAEAAKQRKILEKLRERRLAEFRWRMNRSEDRFLDEIASGQFVRSASAAELES